MQGRNIFAARLLIEHVPNTLVISVLNCLSGGRKRKSRGGNTMINLTINGKSHSVDVEPDTPLLWVIRDNIGMTGTKYGCGITQCGACTVHIDGQAVRSCGMTAGDAAGKRITTIEGLAENGVLTKVQKAWVEHDVPQCGYCQSGMIMAVSALLKEKPKPTDADINEAITNICRCGTFQQVRAAIHAAANGNA
jgi:isoquinoline 1-oxidoreductase alpha subunit